MKNYGTKERREDERWRKSWRRSCTVDTLPLHFHLRGNSFTVNVCEEQGLQTDGQNLAEPGLRTDPCGCSRLNPDPDPGPEPGPGLLLVELKQLRTDVRMEENVSASSGALPPGPTWTHQDSSGAGVWVSCVHPQGSVHPWMHVGLKALKLVELNKWSWRWSVMTTEVFWWSWRTPCPNPALRALSLRPESILHPCPVCWGPGTLVPRFWWSWCHLSLSGVSALMFPSVLLDIVVVWWKQVSILLNPGLRTFVKLFCTDTKQMGLKVVPY